MHFLQRRLLKLILAVASHPRWTLGMAALVVAGCVGASLRWLSISSDENKLFSPNVPFFHDYLQFIEKFPENEAVYIIIEPVNAYAAKPALERWTDLADRITASLNRMPGKVRLADDRVPLDQLGRQGILFENQAKLSGELADSERLIPLAQMWGEKPNSLTTLLGNTPMERFLTGAAARPDDETAAFVSALAESWNKVLRDPSVPMRVGQGVVDMKRLGAVDPSQLGYFYVRDETNHSNYRILVRVYLQRNYFSSLTGVTDAVNAIRQTAVDAARDFPEFRTVVTGRPALDADQMKISDDDSHRAEICALIAVFFGLVVMLRSVRLALVAEIALGVGIGWTFGWTTATVGQLNLLSLVFLIALIGIGMDYLVQILSRYRLEARRYSRPRAIWVRVFAYVGPPINTACLGAAGAFLVSVLTHFQGAAELGIIAGGGLLLCLAAGYIILPALLTLWPMKLEPLAASQRYAARHHRVGGASRWIFPAVWIGALALGSPYIPRPHFDRGLIDLQVQNLDSVREIRTLQTWEAVELSRHLDQLRAVRDRVSRLPSVASTGSVLNAQDNIRWLNEHATSLPTINWTTPTAVTAADLPRIAAKARNLAQQFTPATTTLPSDSPRFKAAGLLRDLAGLSEHLSGSEMSTAATRLSDWQNVFVGQLQDLLGQFHPDPLDINAVPPGLRKHLVSEDGTYALYIYPKKDLWDDANLTEFTTQVESAVASVPGAPAVTGIASNVYHTTGSIHQAFVQATIYSLVLIFTLVFLDFKKLAPTLAAISVLALGLPMLLAIMGYLNINWNFANFFGLPILIGAGHEYGVFMVHRYLEAVRYPRRVWGRWDVSDRALLLCAFITSSSFGFFWLLARHQGLRSLGLVMALGTACIYLATIMVLRPILRWKLDRMPETPGRL